MLTEAEVARLRRELGVTGDQIGGRDPAVSDEQKAPRKDRGGRLRRADGTFAKTTGRTHGKASTYVSGCRCDECRATNTARMRRYARNRSTSEVSR